MAYTKKDMIQRAGEAVISLGLCPIVGLRLSNDQQTATVDPGPGATQLQIDTANNYLAVTFDWTEATHLIWLEMKASAVIGAVTPKRLEANVATNLATLQDVTALMFQLAPNHHYKFEFTGGYFTANVNTGIQLAVNGPAGGTGIVMAEIAISASARTTGVAQAYNTPLIGASSAAATPLPWSVWGTISTGATGGAFLLRACSEVAGSLVTLMDKSHALLHCLG